jgi:hypothetical protein
MSIVLFAIIGATIKAGVGYWVCFAWYCVLDLISFICKILGKILTD